MDGVPADLPLGRFVGESTHQIMIGKFQVSIPFGAAGRVDIRGGWELRDPAGLVIDSGQDHAGRDCYRIHRIIDDPVAGFTLDPPRSFTLVFESGHALVVFDDDHYETFGIAIEGHGTIFV